MYSVLRCLNNTAQIRHKRRGGNMKPVILPAAFFIAVYARCVRHLACVNNLRLLVWFSVFCLIHHTFRIYSSGFWYARRVWWRVHYSGAGGYSFSDSRLIIFSGGLSSGFVCTALQPAHSFLHQQVYGHSGGNGLLLR